MKYFKTRIICLNFIIMVLIFPITIFAGDLNPPAGPPSPTMKTVKELFIQNEEILSTIEGAFECSDAPLPKTGQLNTSVTCDDGDLRKGVPWPEPRFTDNGNGTVTDNLTGLVWLKNADRFGTQTWENAITFCNNLANGGTLTDGSIAGNWRLPNIAELKSLRNLNYSYPCIPNTNGSGQWVAGNPFNNVMSEKYWSSSTTVPVTTSAWTINMGEGDRNITAKNFVYHVWPVRDAE